MPQNKSPNSVSKPFTQQASEVLEVLPETVWESTKLSVGGITEAIGEQWGSQSIDKWGEEVRTNAINELEALRIQEPTFMQKAVLTGASSSAQAIPLMLAAYATKSPHIVTSGFGLMEFGRAYGEARHQDIEQGRAFKYALASGLIETATEYLPTKYLFGKQPSMVGRFAKFFGTEVLGEEVAEVSQRYLEWYGGLADNPSMGELRDIMALTAVATPIGAGGQISVARAVESLNKSYTEVMKKRKVPSFSEQDHARDMFRKNVVLNNGMSGESWWRTKSVEALTTKIQRRKPADAEAWRSELQKQGVTKEEMEWLKINDLKGEVPYELVLQTAMAHDIGLQTITLDASEAEADNASRNNNLARVAPRNVLDEIAQKGGLGRVGGQSKWWQNVGKQYPKYVEAVQAIPKEVFLSHGATTVSNTGKTADDHFYDLPKEMYNTLKSWVDGYGGTFDALLLINRARALRGQPSVDQRQQEFNDAYSHDRLSEAVMGKAYMRLDNDAAMQELMQQMVAINAEFMDGEFTDAKSEDVTTMFDEMRNAQHQMMAVDRARPMFTTWTVAGDRKRDIEILTLLNTHATGAQPEYRGHGFGQEERTPFPDSPQTGDDNILVHTRASIRTDQLTGEEYLFVEEVQSDWHQRTRKAKKEMAEGIVGAQIRSDLKLKNPSLAEEFEMGGVAISRELKNVKEVVRLSKKDPVRHNPYINLFSGPVQAILESRGYTQRQLMEDARQDQLKGPTPMGRLSKAESNTVTAKFAAGKIKEATDYWDELVKQELKPLTKNDRAQDQFGRRLPMPYAPWIETWMDKGLEQGIRYAVNNGINRVAIAHGEDAGAASGFDEESWVFYDKTLKKKLEKRLGKNNREDVSVEGTNADLDEWGEVTGKLNSIASGEYISLSKNLDYGSAAEQALYQYALQSNQVSADDARNIIAHDSAHGLMADEPVLFVDHKMGPHLLTPILNNKELDILEERYAGEYHTHPGGHVTSRIEFVSLPMQSTMTWIEEQVGDAAKPTHTAFRITADKRDEYARGRYKFLGDNKTGKKGSRGYGFRDADDREFQLIKTAMEGLPPVLQQSAAHIGIMHGNKVGDRAGEWDKQLKQISVADWVLEMAAMEEPQFLQRTISHELFHSIDFVRGMEYDGFTQHSQLFDLSMDDFSFDSETKQVTGGKLGALMQEAMDEWSMSDDIDSYGLDYPFVTHVPRVAEISAKNRVGLASKKEIEEAGYLVEEMKVEAAAQLFAMYHAHRDVVEQRMPNTRTVMEKMDAAFRESSTTNGAGRGLQETLWADSSDSDPQGVKILDAAGEAGFAERSASGALEGRPKGRKRPVLNALDEFSEHALKQLEEHVTKLAKKYDGIGQAAHVIESELELFDKIDASNEFALRRVLQELNALTAGNSLRFTPRNQSIRKLVNLKLKGKLGPELKAELEFDLDALRVKQDGVLDLFHKKNLTRSKIANRSRLPTLGMSAKRGDYKGIKRYLVSTERIGVAGIINRRYGKNPVGLAEKQRDLEWRSLTERVSDTKPQEELLAGLQRLENEEAALANEEKRRPTKGMPLKHWHPVSNSELATAIRVHKAGSLYEPEKNNRAGRLPDAVVEAFHGLAEQQRGKPEAAMLKVTMFHSGVMGVVENAGDLTHRISHHAGFGSFYHTLFRPKITAVNNALHHGYGFEKEHEENIENNVRDKQADPIEYRKVLNRLLQDYADEHRKLKVYNVLQKDSRDLAVAIGEQRWDQARKISTRLEESTRDHDDFMREAVKFEFDKKTGEVIPL